MSAKVWLGISAFHGFFAVAMGAFGAHGLKGRLDEAQLAMLDTAARYQMWHALALLGVALLAARPGAAPGWPLNLAGWGFAVGVLLFSGALYVTSLTGSRLAVPLAPLGGLLMLMGWAGLALTALILSDNT